MTDHPLTEEAVAEMWDEHHTPASPTDEMVLTALNAYHREQYRSWGRVNPDTGEVQWADRTHLGEFADAVVKQARATLTAALEVAPNKDDRPWEPLDGRPVRVGDEVRRESGGITTTAAVGRVDDDGDPWTAEGAIIGMLRHGTWHVRRAAPERDGVVLIPADGHEAITTTDGQEFSRLTFTTKQSIWYGPNLAARPGDWVIQTTTPSRLTPDTWKVDEK